MARHPKLKRALQIILGDFAADEVAANPAKKLKTVTLDMYSATVPQGFIEPGDPSKVKPPVSVLKKPASSPPAMKKPAAKEGVLKKTAASDWEILEYVRGPTDKKAGETYKIWVAPDGKTYRSKVSAVAAGFKP